MVLKRSLNIIELIQMTIITMLHCLELLYFENLLLY